MKQIYILEKSDLADLRAGHSMIIALPGGAAIQLQVEGPHKIERDNHEEDGVDRRTIQYRKAPGGGATNSERIVDYLSKNGPAKMIKIATDLGVTRSTVSSALSANRRGLFKKHNKGRNQYGGAWGLK